MPNLKIYTTSTCHYCHMAKEYFKEHDIEYQEFDVSRDETAREEMIKISGQIGVPVITVDENVIIGFDQRKLTELLGVAKEN